MNGAKVKTNNGEDVEHDEHDDDSIARDCPFVRILVRLDNQVEIFSRFYRISNGFSDSTRTFH